MTREPSITVAVYPTRAGAEMARSALEAEGVDAIIVADDAGGLHPDLAFNRGIRLEVAQEDAEAARSVLGSVDVSNETEGSRWGLPERVFVGVVVAVLVFLVFAGAGQSLW